MFQSKVCRRCLHHHSSITGCVKPGNSYHSCTASGCPFIPAWRRKAVDEALVAGRSTFSAVSDLSGSVLQHRVVIR